MNLKVWYLNLLVYLAVTDGDRESAGIASRNLTGPV